MKKRSLPLILALLLGLLSACKAQRQTQPESSTQPPSGATLLCRVVQCQEDRTLVLAGLEGDQDQVYTINLDELEQAEAPEAGNIVEVTYDGATLETYPARFSNPTALQIQADGFDNLCALYLDVLQQLWDTDAGLNGTDLTILGVDLSATRLTPSEQAAVTLCFGQQHGLETVSGTAEALQEQGYFTSDDPEAAEPKSWHWADGCLFTITEQSTQTAGMLKFEAEKWRSGTGAYWFIDCASTQDAAGRWSDFTIGGEAIS